MREFCAACRVDEGECPDCGTFWWRRGSEKIGMRRMSAPEANVCEFCERSVIGRFGGVPMNECPSCRDDFHRVITNTGGLVEVESAGNSETC